jgi:hypothetical protein
LFAGDLEAAGERTLIASRADLRSTILKVPHHGSSTSSTEAFLGAVDPELAVVSLGYFNRYNFPASDVVARYRQMGVGLFRTDQDGEIEVDATRSRIWLRTFRDGWIAPRAAARPGFRFPPPARASVDRTARAVGRFPVGTLLPGAAWNPFRRPGKLPEEMHG